MLGKLLKQEFRATGRIMLPVYGALVMLSVLGNFSIRLLDSGLSDSSVLRFLAVFFIGFFIFGVFAAMIMTLVLMITRFYRNLLKDEGYLMHTLPVSVHGLVWSKLIVSLVWFVVTGLVITLIVCLTALIQSGTNLVDVFAEFPNWAEVKALLADQGIYGRDIALVFTELGALILIGTLANCLHFYAAMAMGHMFNKDKVLLSIVFFVAISFVLSLLTTLLGFRLTDLAALTVESGSSEMLLVYMRRLLVFSIGVELVQGALLYFATTLSLRRGLNLA